MCNPKPRRDINCKIIANAPVADGFYRMELEVKGAAEDFRVGQFFQLKINIGGCDPLLRRPFAPSEISKDSVRFVYAVVGRGTRDMTRLAPGDEAGLLYPLGNGFSLPQKDNSACLLVGGGCGAPSMLALAQKLKSLGHSVHIALGARSKCSLLEAKAMRESSDTLAISTDDGSAGIKGHAVAAAQDIITRLPGNSVDAIFACGPHPMLRGVHEMSVKTGTPCQVSLEERMGCGFGACVGCVVKIIDTSREEGFVYKKVCLDGPVFDSATVIW